MKFNINLIKKIFVLVALTSTFILPQSKVGTTAANFLTIPIGARASGMGGAFVAVANDVTSAFWNPAGLVRIERYELNVSYSEWLVNTKHNWIVFGMKLGMDNAIALSFNQLDFGSEEITTADQPNGTGQFWSADDLAITLSYARNLTDRLSVGGNFKYITQNIYNETATAFALDIGLLFHTEIEGFNIGMNISNFGTEMKLDGKDLLQPVDIDPALTGNNANIASRLSTDSWPLPLVFSVGLSWNLLHSDMWGVTIATDANIPNNQDSYINAGGEIVWNDIVSIRGGYYALGKDASITGITAGFGIKYDFGNFMGKVNYSYTDYGIFKSISRISLSIGL